MSANGIKLGTGALALELAAWAQLAVGGAGEADLVIYLSAHGGAAALLAVFCFGFLPPDFRMPRLPVVLLLFVLIFFIPVLGFVGALTTILMVPMLPRLAAPVKFRSVQLPELDPHERVGGMGFRQPGMRGFLGNAQVPVEMRLRALVALSNVPARLASPLLRDLLADPAEDLRLLAYGMLDSQEKKLNGAIHAQLQTRQNAAHEAARAAAAAKLAALYWELVYQGLVQGDLKRHACEQGLRHAAEALAANPEDAALYFLQGRLLHEDARPDESRAAYREALGLGLPANRVVPYMAELAYDEGDFEEVRNLLGVLRAWPDMPRLAPVVNFWDRA